MGFFLLFLQIQAGLCSQINHLSVDFFRAKDGSRFLESPLEQIETRVGLSLDLEILNPVYWNNRVFFLGGKSQVEWVSWRFEIGINVLKTFDIFFEHNSQHRLDRPGQNYFPTTDGVGVRWIIK